VALRTAGEHSVTATLSPKPASSSIPGQRVGQPRSIPGLEPFEGYAPTLNAKLTQIVFAVPSSAQNSPDFDLYLASRDKPMDAFQSPLRLDACSSSDDECDPTLSPDGLELVFVRTDSSGSTSLMRSIRRSLSDSFSEPQALTVSDLPSGIGIEYDSPQLVTNGGNLIVRVTTTASDGSRKTSFQVHRAAFERPFESAKPLPVFVDQARHFLTGGGVRAFVSQRYAIQLCCRPSLDAPFSAPGRLDALNAARIGMTEGPIWVSPAEDFAFYCVTVANRSHQQCRYLRQVRIR
jgi:hypothetical protein